MNDFTKTTYIMSNGMGVESVAILLRWMHEPATAPCALSDLIVITSQVGNEYADTLQMHQEYILPLFRKHGIRYVQVARKGHLEEEGIVVLDDSREATRMYGEGHYKLSDELMGAGTVPQFGGEHVCSMKFKAFVIESWLAENVPTGTVRHAFGYNLNEGTRVTKSDEGIAKRNAIVFGFNVDESTRYERAAKYDTPFRVGVYPLVEWGWSREQCMAYIEQILGIKWAKSACVFCPFAHNKQSLPDLIERHKRHPEAVADAMLLEHVALSLNPRQTLYSSGSLIQLTLDAGNTQAVESYQEKLTESEWAIYRVRRTYAAGKLDEKTGKPKKGFAARCVEKTAHVGQREEVTGMLAQASKQHSYPKHLLRGIEYTYLEQAGDTYPTREDFLVAAPAICESKTRTTVAKFDEAWEQFQVAQ